MPRVYTNADCTATIELTNCIECNLVIHETGHYYCNVGLPETHPNIICYSCFRHSYMSCWNCGTYRRNETMQRRNNDYYYCASCADRLISCPTCNWERDRNSRACPVCPPPPCCVSPALDITFPNDGRLPITQDVRTTISVARGAIDATGKQRIVDLLVASETVPYRGTAHHAVEAIEPQWQMKTGNYTKRLSRYLHRNHNLKMAPEVLSEVGNIAQQCANATTDWRIELTRDLNRPREDFYNSDSCWWGSLSESRCVAKMSGTIGMRSFNEYGTMTGRVWVMALDEHQHPTFDTMSATSYVVFNGYGRLTSLKSAQLVGHMTGRTYKRIDFTVYNMWVNRGDSTGRPFGYLVSDEETCKRIEGIQLEHWSGDRHRTINRQLAFA